MIWVAINRKLNKKILLVYCLTLVIGLSFYPLENSYNYFVNAIAHNAAFSLASFFTLAVALLFFLGILLYLVHSNRRQRIKLPKLFTSYIASTLVSGLICFFVVQPTYSITTLCVVILCLSVITILTVSYFFRLTDLRSFTYIFIFISLVASSLLYYSQIGRSFYVFIIPMLLCFYQSFSETKRCSIYIFVMVGQLLLGNFFPSLKSINEMKEGLGDEVYTLIFNATYINFLSWSPCKVPTIRQEIERAISMSELPIENNKIIYFNLHQHTQVSLYLPVNFQASHPSFSKLEDSAPDDLNLLKSTTINNISSIFVDSLKSSMFPVIIEGIDTFTADPNLLPDSLPEVLLNDEKSINEFAQVYAREYFTRLRVGGLLDEHYREILIPKESPCIRLYIKKDLYTNQRQRLLSPELVDLINSYEAIESSR